MNKDELIGIYKNTLKLSKEINPKPVTHKYFVEEFDERTEFEYVEDNVTVVNSDTVTALLEESKSGSIICVLNMASYKRPGGGVARGAKAQEECLFRCSNLGIEETEHLYPLQDNSALYTTGATFFKDFNYGLMTGIKCDVLTIAAFNFNPRESHGPIFSDYEKETKDKIRLMFNMAWANEAKILILGAWGCGVFKNDPTKMATMFQEVMDEGYKNLFDKIVFAIINDHNSVDNNYSIFKNILT